MDWISENWLAIGEVVLAVVGLASLIAKMTPTEADDKIVDSVLAFLNKLALNPKKDGARD